jgi:hypothetical protein
MLFLCCKSVTPKILAHYGQKHCSLHILNIPILDVFQGVKEPGSDTDHPPSSNAKVCLGKPKMGENDLYLYSPSVASWHVAG